MLRLNATVFQDEKDSRLFATLLIEASNFGLRTRETTETLIRVCYTKTIVVQISEVIVLVLFPIILRNWSFQEAPHTKSVTG